MMRIVNLGIACIVALAVFTGCPSKKKTFVTIGTGSMTGVYYPTGGAISRMINKKQDTYGIKATAESTGGSVYNINAVLKGDLDFGIAQSDRQYQAVKGLAEWKEAGPRTDLRSVFSIHPESITLVATEKSGINSVKDLKGKRVNLGNPGSGQLQNSKDILAAFGLTDADVTAEQVKAIEAPGLVQDGRIDAFFYTVGHPNGNLKEATAGRIKVKIVPIEGDETKALLDANPYYAVSTIPAKSFYPSSLNTGAVKSIGVKATLVTSAKVADDVVYALTKEVFDNFDEFCKLHPAYTGLKKEDMLAGLSAPIHPGALKYYKEAGLDKQLKPELILK